MMTYNYEKLTVSITHEEEAGNPSKLHISTTLIANNLPPKDPQAAIIKTIKKFFKDTKIVRVSFKHAQR